VGDYVMSANKTVKKILDYLEKDWCNNKRRSEYSFHQTVPTYILLLQIHRLKLQPLVREHHILLKLHSYPLKTQKVRWIAEKTKKANPTQLTFCLYVLANNIDWQWNNKFCYRTTVWGERVSTLSQSHRYKRV
jgi:hypothetical protein